MKSKNSKVNKSSEDQIKEYRRKCKQCGRVWHSLVDREKEIQSDQKTNNLNICGNCCNPSAQLQAKRNVEQGRTELDKLKSCPKCGSHNYGEEVLAHKKKNNILVDVSIWSIRKIWHKSLGRSYNKKFKIRCRFYPSCSNYGILALEKYGFIEGWIKTINRIWRCRPDNYESCVDFP